MSVWTSDELDAFGGPDEIGISSTRADGTDRPFVTIWLDDDLYVRSAYGPDNGWFRRAAASGRGRVRAGGRRPAGGRVRDVAFEVPDAGLAGRLSAAYHAKYDRYGPSMVGTVVSPEAAASTLRLVPR